LTVTPRNLDGDITLTNQELMAKRKTLLREAQGMADGPAKDAKLDEANAYIKQLKNVTNEDVYGFMVQ
jgi:hypothetical protein